MKLISLVGFLQCLFILFPPACAQSASNSGDIRGTLTDASGAVLPKATVTAVDSQTGLHLSGLS